MTILYKTDKDYPSYIHQVLNWVDDTRVALDEVIPVGILEYRDGIFDLSTRRTVNGCFVMADRKTDLKIRFRFKPKLINGAMSRGEKTIKLSNPHNLLYYIDSLRLWVLCTTESYPESLDEALDITIADSRDLVALD